MKLIDIIKKLQAKGHSVAYTHRKDGGYIIRRIDGQVYRGKKGNQVARTLIGEELSLARSVQLRRIRTPKGKRSEKKTALPSGLEKELRKVQRNWRKKHPTIEGTISKRGLRYQFETYGEKQALLSLDKAYRYSEGYAYLENVQTLINRINLDLGKRPSPDMEEVVSIIENKMMIFKEEWLQHCLEALYEWEKGTIDDKECSRQIKAIIN